MNQHPILFSTPMVQAILQGDKTQTRRICKHQNWSYSELIDININKLTDRKDRNVSSPYGNIGDILWVRETWMQGPNYPNFGAKYRYKATESKQFIEEWSKSWKPSIHMPKEACRIYLQINNIRVERLQTISRLDSLAEGIQEHVELEDTKFEKTYYQYEFGGERYDTAIEAYKALWQEINGSPSPIQKKIDGKLTTIGYNVYPFDEETAKPFEGKNTWRGKPLTVIINPWVWVIEFKQIEKPE